MKAVYCRDCKHMQMETRRVKYSLDYYLGVCKPEREWLEMFLFILTVISCGSFIVLLIVVTFIYNLPKKRTEPMCLFSGRDDLVNGGKVESTALTCKVYKDSAQCNHYEERPTIEQEIEETLKKLNEIKGIL